MKKVILLGLIIMVMAGASIAAAAPTVAPIKYKVLVNGHIVTGDTLTQSDTTLAPLKVIFEELEYKITYTEKTKTYKADKKGKSISLTIGSTKALVNGKETKLLVAPKIVNAVTYAPLSFIADASGEKLAFDKGRKAYQIGKQIDWKQLDKASFRNAKWGMSLNQVKKSENSALLEEGKGKNVYLSYQSKIAGIAATANYFFTGSTLTYAGYFVELSGQDSYIEDYKTLGAYLTKQYGEPIVEILQVYHDQGVDYTDEEWDQLIVSGEEQLVATWKAVDSEVMLVVAKDLQAYSDIQITYKSWSAPL